MQKWQINAGVLFCVVLALLAVCFVYPRWRFRERVFYTLDAISPSKDNSDWENTNRLAIIEKLKTITYEEMNHPVPCRAMLVRAKKGKPMTAVFMVTWLALSPDLELIEFYAEGRLVGHMVPGKEPLAGTLTGYRQMLNCSYVYPYWGDSLPSFFRGNELKVLLVGRGNKRSNLVPVIYEQL